VSGTEHFQIMNTSATAKTSSIIGYGVFTANGRGQRQLQLRQEHDHLPQTKRS
jgi:hypothetical protein